MQKTDYMDIFEQAGFTFIDPPILQPLDYFLERMGEYMRPELCYFTNHQGKEYALRPGLTIPSARYYIEKEQNENSNPVLYSYKGKVFRQKPDGQQQEFTQIGIEIINGNSSQNDEKEILQLLKNTLKSMGISEIEEKIITLENKTETHEPLNLSSIQTGQDKLIYGRSEQAIQQRFEAKKTQKIDIPKHNVQENSLKFTYYTDWAFELCDKSTKTVLARGGRYDDLISSLGGKNVPAVGGAISLEHVETILRKRKI